MANKDEEHMIDLGIAGQVSGPRDTRGTGRFLTGSLVEPFSKMAAIVTGWEIFKVTYPDASVAE